MLLQGRYSTPFDEGAPASRQRGADQGAIGREAAAAALVGELVDEADRQRRVGEDRRPDLDGDRADGEEVEHVGELRHAADRDDRDVDDLADLVHDPQRDRLDRRAGQAAVDVAEQRLRPRRRDGDPGQRVDRGQRVGAGVGDGPGDRAARRRRSARASPAAAGRSRAGRPP